MNFSIAKIESLSGKKASIYTVQVEGHSETLLDRFIRENKDEFRQEVTELLVRLKTIGHVTGARETFFKLHEGKPGDGISALYDTEESHLRLYCIRYGQVALIVGGGGQKQGGAWQDYPKLSEENQLLQQISTAILKAMKPPFADLEWSIDGMELIGELNLSTD